jgi:lipoate-protein ligase B
VIGALAAFGIEAAPGADREHVGVWVEDRKIASLGIRASNWVVRHGFALNVDCDLRAFGRFRACGLDATPFTSIARELGRDVTVEEARGPVLAALAATFSLDLSAVPA